MAPTTTTEPAAALPLAGRVALVTGGARRLGAAIVRRLHAGGATVALHYRSSAAEAQALTGQLNALRPDSAAAFACDLLDVDALAGLVAAVTQRFGRLDVLVNNASSFYATPVGSITGAQFDDLVGTNLRAPLFLAQAAAAELRRTHGLILNMADIHGQRPLRAHAVYSAAKAGLIMLTKSLARELGPEIRVNAIAPGPVLWPERGMGEDLRQEIVSKTALGRSGSPDDIASAAWFYVAEAPYDTGQVLAIDGGRGI
ncbi:MAG TPA: pteridine reductase [Steroidobacteraceae bacterium]|nr:pteridine reductase [Steroidobacteraceae bacterium]